MTECIQESFSFTAHFSRGVQAEFTAGHVSSDGGALLLREADRRIDLLGRLSGCFLDGRSPLLVRHRLSEMLAQRIYGLALGYEDLNDHEQLRSDPLLGLLSGKRDLDEPLAGKSTLNRLELTGRSRRYHKISYSAEAIDRLLADLYIESHPTMPDQIVLDLDATDIPLYGHQPERFFHGYYDSYCYLPLYIFAGDQLLCARLRPANQDAAKGSVEEVSRIVAQLRQRWAAVKIVLRGDSGFCREELMAWCEQNHVDYVFGLARNERLGKIIGAQMHQARMPSLLIVFEDYDAISACFDEESQYMLEGSSEPTLCAVFSPTDQEEFLKALRAVERFVRVNLELCELMEEIQGEKGDEGRGRDRSDASIRAA